MCVLINIIVIEDIALMAEMWIQTYRFSIAWTRILPNGTGEVNPKGIEYYNNVT